MCPDISPPSTASCFLMALLILKCPVFSIIAFPPEFSMRIGNWFEHFTSKIIAPFFFSRKCFERIMIRWSARTDLPSLVIMPTLSPSPSNAKPISALFSITVDFNCSKFSSLLGSGWWFGKFPSGFLLIEIVSNPWDLKMLSATSPAAPFPASRTILIFLLSMNFWLISFWYCGNKFIFSQFVSTRSTSACFSTSDSNSKPDIASSLMTILRPLSSLGLWLPVIITPFGVTPVFVAK